MGDLYPGHGHFLHERRMAPGTAGQRKNCIIYCNRLDILKIAILIIKLAFVIIEKWVTQLVPLLCIPVIAIITTSLIQFGSSFIMVIGSIAFFL